MCLIREGSLGRSSDLQFILKSSQKKKKKTKKKKKKNKSIQFGLIVIYKLRTWFFPLHKAICCGPSWWIAWGNCFQMRSVGLGFGVGIWGWNLELEPSTVLSSSQAKPCSCPQPPTRHCPQRGILLPKSPSPCRVGKEKPIRGFLLREGKRQGQALPGGFSTTLSAFPRSFWGIEIISFVWGERISGTRSNWVGFNHNHLMQEYKLPTSSFC